MNPTLSVRFFTDWLPGLLKSRKQKESGEKQIVSKTQDGPSKDVNAAIAMALYLHFNEMHDEESNVITIQRISKTYSPWSSKIYNMRNFR